MKSYDFDLEHIFTYHPTTPEQVESYQAVRKSALYFAETILSVCPSCADRTDAIRKTRESVAAANASIALQGRLYKQNSES